MQQPIVSFRMSFWWLLLVVLLWSIPLGVLIGVAMALLAGGAVPDLVLGAAVLAATATGEAAAALLLLPVVAYYKVCVCPEGVRAFNFWGVYRFAPWADFRRVTPGNFLGLVFLRAHTAGAWTPLWLPTFLADWPGFCRLVRTSAGTDHPLAVALSEAGPQ